MADRIKFTIPGKPEYLTMVRLAIGSVADTMGFDFDEIEDIKTAVTEACKNVPCHGLDGFAEEYSVECIADEGYLEMYVTDNSDGQVLERLAKPCQSCPNEGNLAIFVIQSLMSEVEILDGSQGKKTIKMVKRK
jgi:serine/threonine-protein kinase RsbW